jgi:hypothetical protein
VDRKPGTSANVHKFKIKMENRRFKETLKAEFKKVIAEVMFCNVFE